MLVVFFWLERGPVEMDRSFALISFAGQVLVLLNDRKRLVAAVKSVLLDLQGKYCYS